MKSIDNAYVIWLGSVFNDSSVELEDAISPAGNKWQLRFIRSLINDRNIEVFSFGHKPKRAFPCGPLFVSGDISCTPNDLKQSLAWYFNIPYIRNIFTNLLVVSSIIKLLIKQKKRPHAVITYNIYSYNFLAALVCRFLFFIKWIAVVADPINDRTDKYNPLLKLSNGTVYLSKHLYNQSKAINKLHIEGGVEVFDSEDKNSGDYTGTKYILYTGRVTKHNGIDLLLDAFKLVPDPSLHLIVTGKCEDVVARRFLSRGERVVYKGVVSEVELQQLYRNATICVNPRLIGDKTNTSIFPSKLLEYLSYYKPIVSTYTPGISEEYTEVIKFVYEDSPEKLASLIGEVVNWDEEMVVQNTARVKRFVSNFKTWERMTANFWRWLLTIK
ncbi:glycosyltransferase family 4 protein [Desertivirga xinjiangensis]|uniref:glycosyltransferase family 4 protein n=1 Tax=Desertivirga xinjiangensis TaxID=539206 RepID=UPI00210A23ED|nr:glycosyltransferase family 4 protein [Pedobacter xinjiangensis]